MQIQEGQQLQCNAALISLCTVGLLPQHMIVIPPYGSASESSTYLSTVMISSNTTDSSKSNACLLCSHQNELDRSQCGIVAGAFGWSQGGAAGVGAVLHRQGLPKRLADALCQEKNVTSILDTLPRESLV